jgi:hypothetical protein
MSNFYDALYATGRRNEWSQADVDTARLHPSFKQSMVTLKDRWHNEKDNRDAIHAEANRLRNSYAGRTAAPDGSGYNAAGYWQTLERDGIHRAAGFNPAYNPFQNQWGNDQRTAWDRVQSREPFSYDKNNDPQWQAMRKQYLREAERARADTMGRASAMTGGRPSSFAVTAASQAGDYFTGQLADRIPELYRQAYDRYMNEFQMNRQKLDDVNAMQQRDFDQWYGASRFDRDVNNDAYGRILDQIGLSAGQISREDEKMRQARLDALDAEERSYGRERDAVGDRQWQADFDRLTRRFSFM